MILGAFLATLNATVMSVAIPELIGEFNISPATGQWLTTGYMLVNGVLIPVTAYLMQRFSTRQLFLTSMLIFLVGTVVCALSSDFASLLSGRMIQAVGAGIIMPLLLQVVLTIFPPDNRGVAMGMVGLALVFAPAIGPVFSGYILENYDWKTMFYVIIPLTVIVIGLSLIFLKNVSETISTKIDLLSVVLSTIAFGGLLFGFSRAGSLGWSSQEVIASIIAGILALILFSWRQLACKYPLLDLRTFKFNMFSLTTVISIAVNMVMYADMMLLPLYLQNVRGYTPLESGLLMLPGAVLMGVLMPLAGKLFDRFGAKWLAIIGLVITIITTIGFIDLTDSTSYTYLLLMSTGRRIGISLLMMPLQTAGLNQLPPKLEAHGNAITNTVRQVAGAMGTSLLVTVMTDRTKAHLTDTMAAGLASGMTEKQLKLDAMIQGINDAYVVIVGFVVIALLLSFFIKRTVITKTSHVHSESLSAHSVSES
ncbi:DHA2 family efflux MFS transporter permease subunit [Gorillibacterium massiliense]|uniref:DHA2 family efflux MFS transporter permease subunit n=1 Tax=Gorillibacterium massiliense TaxID=1280390 RepID=UPI0009DE3B5A|nr:DHA2 family efflux MFS transporter permease subunit [Gorillibacterium massiliense]